MDWRLGGSGGYSFTGSGFVGGAQIGYNYQMGHLVVGIEADFSYDNYLTSSVTSVASPAWVGSLRPRLGYASGPWLFYARAVSLMQTLTSPVSRPTPIFA
jgi:hypothetical protein